MLAQTYVKPMSMVGLALALLLISGNGTAEETNFTDRKSEGWFFYNELEEKVIEPDEPLDPQPTVTATPPPEQKPAPALPPEPPSAPPPQALSAEWMRENLPKYMDRAWDDPSPENVQAFFYLQRYAMDRSGEFAEVAQQVTMGNAMLDESSRRPFSTSAAQDLDRIAGQNRNVILQDISTQAGLFVFYTGQCQLCQTMAPVLKHLDGQFEMTPISLDGTDLPGNPFPSMRVDEGHAERLGVQSLPAIYLVSPDAEFIPLAQGAVSLTDLRERIVLGAMQMGLVSQDDYNRTRTVNNLHLNLTNRSLNLQAPADDPTGFIEPSDVIDALRQSSERSAPEKY
ncbi:conjugal transfer protein TraF [Halomonas sp. 86]|uniref:conjugal transfer protein TraF n=1 Tax=unclassified Halomonas TaxID=2609666 RepID=UPI004034D3B9